jgi:uncharacterized protein YecE (DUF72 family)
MIKVGLCGFTTSMREYYETFRVVEIQHTFYEPPPPRTLLEWREQSPPKFEFTIKAWQLVTHQATSNTYRRLKRTPLSDRDRKGLGSFKPSDVVRRGWEATLESARILRATAILFQCPASFRPEPENIDNMRRFFAGIEKERPPNVTLLWEPRGDWPDETVRALCEELRLVHAVDPFVRPSLTPELTYWRFHGLNDHYRSYTDDELDRIIEWTKDPARQTTYVMFNEVPRVMDARRFLLRLRGRR